jgi:xylulokinase
MDTTNCSRRHILRATVEGATFGLKSGINDLATLKLPADEIVLTGGGANSPVWQQIVADITGLPVKLLAQNEGAGFGAALQALWTLRRQSDSATTIRDITDEHIRTDDSQCREPVPANVAAYRNAYQDYQRVLQQLTPLYSQ